MNNKKNQPIYDENIQSNTIGVVEESGIRYLEFYDALDLARSQARNLVQIGKDKDGIPVCKIVTLDKFQFEQQRKERKTKQKVKEKEIRIESNIGPGDLEIKAKTAIKLLQDGNKVTIKIKIARVKRVFNKKTKVVDISTNQNNQDSIYEFFKTRKDIKVQEMKQQGRFLYTFLISLK